MSITTILFAILAGYLGFKAIMVLAIILAILQFAVHIGGMMK